MKEYDEEDYLLLSGIQHFKFCRRQWALIHIEKVWEENSRTAEGRLMHDNAHDRTFTEKRKNVIISRAMPVHSRTLGTSGECDIAEFVRDDENGVELFGREGKYRICPVEYKRGKPKEGDEDTSQLVAQALCIEEMFCCTVDKGYLYYGMTKHRLEVCITDEMRENVRNTFAEMHGLFESGHTPVVRRNKSCNACSLADVCLPMMGGRLSAREYIENMLDEREDLK